MANHSSFRRGLALLTTSFALTLASPGHADGDESFSGLFDEVDVGLGLSFEGIGLSGRREGNMTFPLEEATLSLTDIPEGATIRHAYLYWVVYGSNGDAEVELDGNELTGTLIGTSAHTCWTKTQGSDLVGDPNRVYRADVKSLVTGSGDYVLTGFPAVELDSDTQGAQLVVLYDDPASNTPRRVTVRDGAITGSFETAQPTDTFPLHDEGPYLEAFWHLACGDGQVAAPDGLTRFAGKSAANIAGGFNFRSSAGQYWDSLTFDVSDRLDLSDPLTGRWQVNNSEGDCIVYAVSALNYTLEALPEPEPGGGGAGGQSTSGDAGGGSGGSSAVTGGAPGSDPGAEGGESAVSMGGNGKPSGSGGDGHSSNAGGDDSGTIDDADARDTGGCGCRLPASPHSGVAALLSVLGLAALVSRRRRR